MIKLYIEKDSVEYLTDLNKDEAITLTTQINDFEAISGQTAPYTLQFTIPCSDKNNSILKQYSKIDISGSINPHQSIDARLVMGEIMEVKGGIEVKGYSWENGKPHDYKIVFYGQEFAIKTLLSKQLNQLDWSDYDYGLTYENMKLSWDLDLADGKVLLPIMSHVRDYLYQPDIGNGQNHPNNIANNTPYYEDDDDEMVNPIKPGIRLDELKTALKLKAMVENIYDSIGVSVTWGTTIDDYLDNVFVIPSKEAGEAKNEAASQDNDVCVVKYDSIDYQTMSDTYTTINMPTTVQDNGDFWDGTNKFTANSNGVHVFSLMISGAEDICIKRLTELKWRAYKNGTTQFGDESDWIFCKASPMVSFEGNLSEGDYVQFQGKTDSGTMGFTNYQMVLEASPNTFYDQTTAIADNMPEMTAHDFIKGFLATYNLMQVIELIDITVQSIHIIDKDEFYTTGTVRDWTKYVSTGKRVYNKPEIDKDLILRYSEYDDKVNIAFFKQALRNYAQLTYISEADFTGKDLDNTSIFTAFPPSFINKLDEYGQPDKPTDLLMHSQFDNDGKAINSDFLIFMYNGKQEEKNRYYIQNSASAGGVPGFTSETDYPYCSSSESYPGSEDDYAINYSVERPASGDMGSRAENTAAKVFFYNYLQNLYGEQSKILTVDAVIPLKEINDFSLNDTIEIQGIRYVVDTMKRNLLTGITKLKLFTYNAGVEYTKPTGYTNAGDVTFNDTPTNNELVTYNAMLNNRVNINEGQLYLWKDYKVSIKKEALVTQADLNFKLLPKAQGYAVSDGGAFTINTDSTQVLTIYDTINKDVKVKFNGEPTVVVTHSDVTVTHNTIPVTYASSHVGRIYVYEAGTYQFSSYTNFSQATLPQDVKLTLAVNGVGFYSRPLVTADQTTDWSIDMNIIIPLDIGDYVELLIAGTISQAYTINSATTNINRI